MFEIKIFFWFILLAALVITRAIEKAAEAAFVTNKKLMRFWENELGVQVGDILILADGRVVTWTKNQCWEFIEK